jgi:hypothetical protein
LEKINMPDIKVTNIGPVTEFEYAIEGYGLHVLRGRQGAGKTTILRTVQLATNGTTDVKPQRRDNTPRGEAYIAGHTLRIAKQTRMEGEIEVDGLGDVSISDLHSPPYKDADTRDRHRIRTLVRLAGAKADASAFYELLGGQERFREIVPETALKTDDIVEMASRIKGAIEAEGRRIEKQVETAEADARAQDAIADGVDRTLPHDEWALNRAQEQAIEAHGKVKEKRAAYRRTQAAAAEAREKLEQFPPGKSVSEASESFERAANALRTANLEVIRLKDMLKDAEAAQALAAECERGARNELNSANAQVSLRGELDAAIEAASGATETTEEAVEQAEEARIAASQAVATGMKIRQAIAAESASKQHKEEAKRLKVIADRLRAAAEDTATVLTNAISSLHGCPLFVRVSESGDPRLALKTARAENEYFDDLSDGSRWPIIIGIAAGSNRLIVLPQAAYGELSHGTRENIHQLAKANECYILTAIADDCALTAHPFEDGKVEAAE